MPDVYVGVDGGGTHARAVVVDAAGRELARLTGPAGLVDPRDPAAAAHVVAGIVRDALHAAGVGSAAVLCCGLAGAGRGQQREAVRVALVLEHIASDVLVIGDAAAAMADAFPSESGVLVIAGTGSIAWARNHGEPVRVGGWGQLLGDEGSAWALGIGALRAVVRAADRLEETALTEAVLTHAGLRDLTDLIAWSADASKATIAALAPAVLDCADHGDAAASQLRARAVDDLVELTITACARTGLPAPAIALTGGLIGPGGPLRDSLIAALTARLDGVRVLDRAIDAAAGAARIAREARPS